MFGGIFPSYAADLQMFSNAKLMNNTANDGDSFFVESEGKSFHVRLYFVDCPETSTSSKNDARRVREQTRYFGLSQATRTIHFGNEAITFIERILSKPFTVHTAFASALPWEGQPKAVYTDSSLQLTEMIWQVYSLKMALLVLTV